MAYFPNGCAGEVFDRQCMRCKYGEKPCPIALVQMVHNYEACNNKVAREILDTLVSDSGACRMFALDPEGLAKSPDAVVDMDRRMKEWQELNK